MDNTKIFATITFLITFVGAIVAAENHYAKASDLSEKADASTVAAIQREILLDKKEEVEYDLFVLEQKEEKTELDEFRIEKLRSRLKDLEKALE